MAVTLMELMVVVLIIGILSTIATGVYTGKTHEARIAAAHALIHNLEVAITRYELDTGSLPPSGTGLLPLEPITSGTATLNRENGSGYLHEALLHSVSGSAMTPASSLWKGPYINLQVDQIQPKPGDAPTPGMINIVDPWGNPILYFASSEYGVSSGNYWGGTKMFAAPTAGGHPNLPAPNPYAASEIYYNPKTFQLISYGPDGTTMASGAGESYAGAAADDINNFGY